MGRSRSTGQTSVQQPRSGARLDARCMKDLTPVRRLKRPRALADTGLVAAVVRYRISAAVVLGALAGVSAVFLFARPVFRPQYESEMIDFAQRDYYGPQRVRQAFEARSVRLRYRTGFAGFLSFSNTPSFTADSLQVNIAPRTGKGSWGPRLEAYDVRFGNIFVSYGGDDRALLQRVQSAVETLR